MHLMEAAMKRDKAKCQVLAIVPVVLLMLAACAGATASPTPSPDDEAELFGSLTVLEWPYYEVPEMWADFAEAHPDIPVDFMFGSSDEDVFAQTQAVSGADIVHFYTPF